MRGEADSSDIPALASAADKGACQGHRCQSHRRGSSLFLQHQMTVATESEPDTSVLDSPDHAEKDHPINPPTLPFPQLIPLLHVRIRKQDARV